MNSSDFRATANQNAEHCQISVKGRGLYAAPLHRRPHFLCQVSVAGGLVTIANASAVWRQRVGATSAAQVAAPVAGARCEARRRAKEAAAS